MTNTFYSYRCILSFSSTTIGTAQRGSGEGFIRFFSTIQQIKRERDDPSDGVPTLPITKGCIWTIANMLGTRRQAPRVLDDSNVIYQIPQSTCIPNPFNSSEFSVERA